MEYARNRWGRRKWTWEMSLTDAKAQPFVCFHCGVQLAVAKMPGLDLSAHRPVGIRFSEFYFRSIKLKPHGDCVYNPKIVAAVMEKRLIQTKAGRPGAPPAAISFERELVRDASRATAGDGEADARRTVRGRYVDGDEVVPQRGDRATVSTAIERAALAHASALIKPWSRLRVDCIDDGAGTYGEVFQSAVTAMPGRTRIWFSTLRFTSQPVVDGHWMMLQCFDREVLIDRSAWRPAERSTFDSELSICLDYVRERWKPGGSSVSPRLYVLCEGSLPDAALRVADPRKLSLAVLVR